MNDRFHAILATVVTLTCLAMGFYLYTHGHDGGLFIGAAFPSAASGMQAIGNRQSAIEDTSTPARTEEGNTN